MITKSSDEQPVRVRAAAQNIKRWIPPIASVLALLLTGTFASGTAFATPGQGVTQTPIASGVLPQTIRLRFAETPPRRHISQSLPRAFSQTAATTYTFDNGVGFGNGLDVSTVSIVKNVIAPGGYFGWHQHSGPSWIVVTQGTLTFYDTDSGTCEGHQVSAGQAFLDAGDHTHNARNETSTPVENYVVRMLPVGGAVRIDKPAPDVCDF